MTELRAAVELLGEEIDDPRPGADMVVSALLDMLLLYILRAWFDISMEHCKVDSWAAALSEIAAAVGYGSKFAFADAFKREYGMAPANKYRRLGCPPTGRTAAGAAPA